MPARLALVSIILAGAIALLVIFGRSPRDSRPEPAGAGNAATTPPPALPAPPPSAAREPAGELAGDPERLRRRLYELLGEPLEGNDVRERMEKIIAHRAALDELLALLGPEDVDLIAEMLAGEWNFLDRRAMLRRLGEIGTDHAANLLVEHYWTLAAAGVETELNYTIEALGTVQSPHSFTLLTDLIGTEHTYHHRFRFVEQLGRHRDNIQAVPTFLRVADSANEDYFKTRSRAALALKWADDPRSAPQVERLLDSEQDNYVRQALCGTLGELGDPASVGKLAAIARTDTNHQTRMSAIRALSRIGGDDARGVIEELRESDGHERVRLEATRALEQMDENG